MRFADNDPHQPVGAVDIPCSSGPSPTRLHVIVMPRRSSGELCHLRGAVFAALYYLGWTKPQIAEEFGCNQQRVGVLIKAARAADFSQVKKLIDDLPQVLSEIIEEVKA